MKSEVRRRPLLLAFAVALVLAATSSHSEVVELAFLPPDPGLVLVLEAPATESAEVSRLFQEEILLALGLRGQHRDLIETLAPHVQQQPARVVLARFGEGNSVLALFRLPTESSSLPDLVAERLARLARLEDASAGRSVARLGARLIAFGESSLVAKSFDLYRAHERSGDGAAFPPVDLPPPSERPGEVWGLASGKGLGLDADFSEADIGGFSLSRGLAAVESVHYSASVSSGEILFEMTSRVSSEEAGSVLAEALREFSTRMRSGSRHPEVGESLSRSSIEHLGDRVVYRQPLTVAALERLQGHAASRALMTWALGPEARERTQRVGRVFEALDLEAGDRVADVGAGDGFFTVRLGRALSSSLRVTAVDVSEKAVEGLRARARASDLHNVSVVLGELDDPRLAVGSFEAILIVNAYHEMSQYEAMLSHIHRALVPGGRLVLLEPFEPGRRSEARELQTGDHLLAPELAEVDLRRAGFDLLERQDEYVPGSHSGSRQRQWLIVATPIPDSETRSVLGRGDRAPVFEVNTLAGGVLSNLPPEAAPTVLSFWATWCEPCMAELPRLAAIEGRFGAMRLVGVSLDEDCESVRSVVERRELRWAQVCSGRAYDDELVRQFDVVGVPTLIVIGRDGIIVSRGHELGEVEEALEEIVVDEHALPQRGAP